MAIDKANLEEWKQLDAATDAETIERDMRAEAVRALLAEVERLQGEGNCRPLSPEDYARLKSAQMEGVGALLPGFPLEDWDPRTGVAQIAGVKYDVAIFSGLGVAPPGTWVRIVARQDGVLTLQLRPDAEAERERLRSLLREVGTDYREPGHDGKTTVGGARCRACGRVTPSTAPPFSACAPDCRLAAELK